MTNDLDLWQKHLDTIKDYFDRKPSYEALCSEVCYILEKSLKEAGIEVASITSRVKKLDSFLNKIERKNYDAPLKQTTDMAAARIVCLYKADIKKVMKLVRQHFEIIEEVDKTTIDVDRFGYLAMHYVVKISRTSSGARYDGLRNLLCEIQIRTILQDAWAIIDHHMRYKKEQPYAAQQCVAAEAAKQGSYAFPLCRSRPR